VLLNRRRRQRAAEDRDLVGLPLKKLLVDAVRQPPRLS